MKYTEIKDKSLKELHELLKEKKMELFTLRVKLKTMQLQNTSELRKVRKDIARIKTAITAAMKQQEKGE
ncbi:MAG: 50S ribosomal protein L29 [Epsilonproteobacteria bacterium]|nr:50S ribosomal protein L29 [Campylobacterota bacterium]